MLEMWIKLSCIICKGPATLQVSFLMALGHHTLDILGLVWNGQWFNVYSQWHHLCRKLGTNWSNIFHYTDILGSHHTEYYCFCRSLPKHIRSHDLLHYAPLRKGGRDYFPDILVWIVCLDSINMTYTAKALGFVLTIVEGFRKVGWWIFNFL